MAVHAATATPTTMIGTTGAAILLTTLAAVTLCYLLACWLYPFGPCRRCHGTGKRRSPLGGGRTFGLCRRCDGTGRRIRIGRHVLNYLRERRDRAR